MIGSTRITGRIAVMWGLTLLAGIAATQAVFAEPGPLRTRPDVIGWAKQADAAPDKLEVWRKAAKEGNAFVKDVAVEELVKLEDERGLAILQQLMDEPVPYSPDVPNYRDDARQAKDTLQDRLAWKKNVASKPDGAEKISAARQALLGDRTGVRQMAFKYLREVDEPKKVAEIALESYDKANDIYVLELTYDLLQKHQMEDWVVPYLQKIKDTWSTMHPLTKEICVVPAAAADTLDRISARKCWDGLNAGADTPAKKKTAALKALTEHRDQFLQRWAVDHLITLDDQDLIPVWVQGIVTDKRVPDKLVKLGKKAVPELISFIDVNYDDRGDDLVRAQVAMDVLAQIKDERAISPLMRIMQLNDNPGKANLAELRSSARIALEAFGDAGLRALIKIMNESRNEHSVIEAAFGLLVVGDKAEIAPVEARLAREKLKAKPSESIVEELQIVLDGLKEKLTHSKVDEG